MMETIVITCPQCAADLVMEPEVYGRRECPECHAHFRIRPFPGIGKMAWATSLDPATIDLNRRTR